MFLKVAHLFALFSSSMYVCGSVISTNDPSLSSQISKSIQLFQQLADLSNSTSVQSGDLRTGLITLPGGRTLNLLSVLLMPLREICLLADGATGHLACLICSNDCTYVHNKFGGDCGGSSGSDKVGLCVCNDSAPKNGHNVQDGLAACGPITGNAVVDNEINLASKHLLRSIITKYQNCIPPEGQSLSQGESLGCMLDCQISHSYKIGKCVKDDPVDTFLGEENVGFYCGCFDKL